jgi:hypothetical protein
VSYDSDELLLIAKAFMKASYNGKHRTGKNAYNLWQEVNLHFEEFVATTNNLNESNPDIIPIEAIIGLNLYTNGGGDVYSLLSVYWYCPQKSNNLW